MTPDPVTVMVQATSEVGAPCGASAAARPGGEGTVNADGARVVALSDYERRAGAGAALDAEEFDRRSPTWPG